MKGTARPAVAPLYYGSGAHVGGTTYGNIGSRTGLDFTVIGLLQSTWLRVSRVFLTGDAVHQTRPFLGQGLCAGIRDAANWVWKLALVLRGNADDSMLDSNETERKPHVRAVVASVKQFGKIIGELDPAAAATRDRRLRAKLRSGRAETIRQIFVPDLDSGLISCGGPWPRSRA